MLTTTRFRSPRSMLLAAACLMPLASAPLRAESIMIDFNDLGLSPTGTHMQDGYQNFRWTTSDWHYMSLASNPSDTYLVLSGTATSVVSQDGQDFYFDGADLWSRRGLDANGRCYFILSRDGVTVYDGREEDDGRMVFLAAHQIFSPGYTGLIDRFAIVFDQGGDDWDHLAMDNVRIRTVPPPACPGDTNSDRVVNGADLSVLLAQFGSTVTPGSGADLNADGNVNSADLSVVLAQFGSPC